MEFEKRIKLLDKNLKGLPLHDISYLTYILDDVLYNNETKTILFISNYLNITIFHRFDNPNFNLFYNDYKNSKDLEYALEIAQKHIALYNFYAAFQITNSYILHLDKHHAFKQTKNIQYIVKGATKKFINYPKPSFFNKDAKKIIINQQLDLLYYIHGICLYMLNDNQSAQNSLANAYLYNPADIDIVIMYIEILTLNNEVGKALELIKAYLPLAYDSLYLLGLLQLAANCYIQKQDIFAATTCLFMVLPYANKNKNVIRQNINNINKQKVNKPSKKQLNKQLNDLGLYLPTKQTLAQVIAHAKHSMKHNPLLAKELFEQLNQIFTNQYDKELIEIYNILDKYDPRNIDVEDLDDSYFADNKLLEQLIYWALEDPNPENNYKVFYALGKSNLYLLGTPTSSLQDIDPQLSTLEDGTNEISLFTDEHEIDMFINYYDNAYTKQKISFLQVIKMFDNPSFNISQIAINPTSNNELIIDEHSLMIIENMLKYFDNRILS